MTEEPEVVDALAPATAGTWRAINLARVRTSGTQTR